MPAAKKKRKPRSQKRPTTRDDLATVLKDVRGFHQKEARYLKGLSKTEVAKLARALHRKIPTCLAEVLSVCGLKGEPLSCFPLEFLGSKEDWVGNCEFAEELLKRNDLVPFAGDGAGNLYALLEDDGPGRRVYFVDHERRELKDTRRSLGAHLARQWRAVKKTLAKKKGPREWSVEFSFDGKWTEAEVMRMLGARLGAEFPGEWENVQQLKSGVQTGDRAMLVAGETYKLGRDYFKGWVGNGWTFHFTVGDSEDHVDDGKIARFRKAFKKAGMIAQECDYGLM